MNKTRSLVHDLNEHICFSLTNLYNGEPFALLDFPNHSNVGDSAIWLGEMKYFRSRHGVSPSYVSTISDYDESDLERFVGDGTIFLHGGGNFGDIWLDNHAFREKIIRERKSNKIIQLPQSIHFASEESIDRTARLISDHGNFALLVRDLESKAFADRRFDCEVILCPDMAFCIGEIDSRPAQMRMLAILRTDAERAAEYATHRFENLQVEDWLIESKASVRLQKLIGILGAYAQLNPSGARTAKFCAAAETRLARGVLQLSRAQALISDRLHVHILALLLRRPHAVIDNSYGKLSRFISAFTERSDLCYVAKSLEDAYSWAETRSSSIKA